MDYVEKSNSTFHRIFLFDRTYRRQIGLELEAQNLLQKDSLQEVRSTCREMNLDLPRPWKGIEDDK